MSFQIEPYSIADFLEWHRTNRLKLNPNFQRRDVWSLGEKTLLIDTILRSYSMPKIYFRTVIDATTQQMTRDVVDGQQRLKAIIAFGENKLKLSSKAKEFANKTYKDLDLESQQRFLQYRIATEQLINASDEAVVNIFTRLNQYGVKLNKAELRNAEFDNDFKWFVAEKSKKYWKSFLDNGFITLKQRSRMIDDELIAELAQIQIKGIYGGDANSIRSLYIANGNKKTGVAGLSENMDSTLNYILEISDRIPEQLKSRPHFVLLYAGAYNAIFPGSLIGFIDPKNINLTFRLPRNEDELDSLTQGMENLSRIISSDEVPEKVWEKFYLASRSAPISIKSRRERFNIYALLFSEDQYVGSPAII